MVRASMRLGPFPSPGCRQVYSHSVDWSTSRTEPPRRRRPSEGGAMERYELEAWLGPALDDLTTEQVDRLHREAQAIEARYPSPDDTDDREAALTAAVQYMLGELTVEEAGRRRRETKAAERHARVQAIQVALMSAEDGMPTAAAAREVGLDRQVLIRRAGGMRRTV